MDPLRYSGLGILDPSRYSGPFEAFLIIWGILYHMRYSRLFKVFWTFWGILDSLGYSGLLEVFWTPIGIVDPLGYFGPVKVFCTLWGILDPLRYSGLYELFWYPWEILISRRYSNTSDLRYSGTFEAIPLPLLQILQKLLRKGVKRLPIRNCRRDVSEIDYRLVINIKIDYEILFTTFFHGSPMVALPEGLTLAFNKCDIICRPFLPRVWSQTCYVLSIMWHRKCKIGKKWALKKIKLWSLTTLLIERFTNCLLDSLMITIWLKRKHQKHLNCCSPDPCFST